MTYQWWLMEQVLMEIRRQSKWFHGVTNIICYGLRRLPGTHSCRWDGLKIPETLNWTVRFWLEPKLQNVPKLVNRLVNTDITAVWSMGSTLSRAEQRGFHEELKFMTFSVVILPLVSVFCFDLPGLHESKWKPSKELVFTLSS